ncbi:MAG TPA: DsbA family protein [Stellaceae bacterium]|jgi:predicted DsbA family dithiol-disulfide isomerase|nr:DsbA family protein [Stellaceae bacterium]
MATQDHAADSPFDPAVGRPLGPRMVLHWYDFICPYCYVGQQRSQILREHGFELVELPFQAHPEISPGGMAVGPRQGSRYAHLEQEAAAAGLPLNWPDRLPNSRLALAAAEWVRRHQSPLFHAVQTALFAAHFRDRQDIGDPALIEGLASAQGVDRAGLKAALEDGAAYAAVAAGETLGRRYGVQGTPAWLIAGKLVPGLFPQEDFRRIVAAIPG